MTIIERSEILATLHKLKADASALFVRAQDCRCVNVGVVAQEVRDLVGDKIDEMQGLQVPARPRQIEFPTPKN